MARATLRTSHLSWSGREAGPVMFSQEASEDSTGSPSGSDGVLSDRDLSPRIELWDVSKSMVLWTLRGDRRRQERSRSR